MRTCPRAYHGRVGRGGVATLGRALADVLVASHHGTDDYYWRPTTPPFVEKRDIPEHVRPEHVRPEHVRPERVRLMRDMFLERSDWVLSGALESWGAPLVRYFDLVAFVYTPTTLRLQRLAERESRHFGANAIAPGGWRHE